MVVSKMLKISISAFICVMSLIVLYSQMSQGTDTNSLDKERTVVTDTVESFWQFTESGKLAKATELTTDTFKEFTIKVKGADPDATWLKRRGFRHKQIAVNKKKSDDLYEVRVRVVDDRQREYWLFHDVVRTNSGDWKILTTSF